MFLIVSISYHVLCNVNCIHAKRKSLCTVSYRHWHCHLRTEILGCLYDLWIHKQCVRPLPFLRLLVVCSTREHESGAKNVLIFLFLLFDHSVGFFHHGKLQFWQKENAFVKLPLERWLYISSEGTTSVLLSWEI